MDINNDAYGQFKDGLDTKRFYSAYDFAAIVTERKRTDPRYAWLKGASVAATCRAIQDCEKVFKGYFKHMNGHPKYKSRKIGNGFTSYYFAVKPAGFHIHLNDPKWKNRIYLPKLHSIRCPRKNLLPAEEYVTSGRVIRTKEEKYFIMVNYLKEPNKDYSWDSNGIGIDLGLEYFAHVADECNNIIRIESFLKSKRYREIEAAIHDTQRIRSHKVQINLQRLIDDYKNNHNGEEPNDDMVKIFKSEACTTKTIYRLNRKIIRFNRLRTCYTRDKVCKIVNELTKTKPEYITIEDLDIIGLLQNDPDVPGKHTIHDHILYSRWAEFRYRMYTKCQELHIELRLAERDFGSSKYCSVCGTRNDQYGLKDRYFICYECGSIMHRDENAARNLCKTSNYETIVTRYTH